jgi:hypothetical protein
MPHVVEPFTNASFCYALQRLRAAHSYLVSRAKEAINAADFAESSWGTSVKRSPVRLNVGDVPPLIGKSEERLGEVINIAATVERLIDAIGWFAAQPQCEGYKILECHPSTSDEADGNDLVIIDPTGKIAIRCEVCDVASTNAGSNNKETKDIRNLGCDEAVPDDDVARYVCTASEFANALASPKRKWGSKPYRYELIETGTRAGTCMLLIKSADEDDNGQ